MDESKFGKIYLYNTETKTRGDEVPMTLEKKAEFLDKWERMGLNIENGEVHDFLGLPQEQALAITGWNAVPREWGT